MKIDVNYQFKNLDGRGIRELNESIHVDSLIKDLNAIKKWEDFTSLRDDIKAKKGKAFTLRSACLIVLTNPPQEIVERTGRAKESSAEHNLMLGELAREIYKSNGLIDLTVDDVKLLKEYINKRYNRNPLIVTQAYEILDPADVEKKKK